MAINQFWCFTTKPGRPTKVTGKNIKVLQKMRHPYYKDEKGNKHLDTKKSIPYTMLVAESPSGTGTVYKLVKNNDYKRFVKKYGKA